MCAPLPQVQEMNTSAPRQWRDLHHGPDRPFIAPTPPPTGAGDDHVRPRQWRVLHPGPDKGDDEGVPQLRVPRLALPRPRLPPHHARLRLPQLRRPLLLHVRTDSHCSFIKFDRSIHTCYTCAPTLIVHSSSLTGIYTPATRALRLSLFIHQV
jgi:hypothetical protein